MEVSRVQTLVLLCIALHLTGCNSNKPQPQADARKITVADARKTTVAVVQSKSKTIKHDYKCTIYGQHFMEVRATADGYLAEVSVKEGQTVKKGDPLFKIRPPGDKEKKPNDRDRLASAAVGQAVMASEIWFRLQPPDDEEKPKVSTQDQVISIKAPSDGVIARLTRQPGCFVWKGDFLTTVVRNSVIWAEFKVPEKDYLESAIEWSISHQNEQIKLILADQSKFPHAGESCGPQGGSNWGPGIRFLAKFPNPDGLLRGGRSGTVSVSREWKDAIFLPRRATFADRFTRYVYVVDKSQVAHRREIVIEDGTKDFLVVKEGVGLGDRIVVDGAEQVRDGDKVE